VHTNLHSSTCYWGSDKVFSKRHLSSGNKT
jgi:hypothetical protein